MLVFHTIVVAMLAVILATAAGNLAYFAWVGRGRRGEEGAGEPPLVSVLVPARNEEARIGACLEALAAQDYAPIEVLVLDDCSEDDTAAIARSYAGRVPGLRILAGEPLPAGWVGKPHACARLAEEARGAWLLFTDADVRHAPESVSRGLSIARSWRAGLLTALPRQEMGTFAETLAIPLLYFAVAGLLPMFAIGWFRWSKLAAASGQYMLFRREVYEAVGGHAGVRGELVEDVALARAVRRARFGLAIANGSRLATCRMYGGLREVVEGFSKNAYAGLGRSTTSLAVVVVAALALFVVPPVGLVAGLATGAPPASWAWFGLETALALAARLLLALAFGHRLWVVLLHPLAVLFALGIAVRSFWLTRFGGGVLWRGRRYA